MTPTLDKQVLEAKDPIDKALGALLQEIARTSDRAAELIEQDLAAGRSWAVVMAQTACALPEAESACLRRYIMRQAARFDAPIWPDDLQLSHARLSARERTAVDWRSNELFRARRHLWRWAVWHWNGMLIRPVDSALEIVREGEQNCNCVAGYAKPHMEGRKIIFVLRHADRPRESWHTVELMPDTLAVVQCRGCHNAPATPEAREFIGLWMERLQAMRSERSKSA